jgi:hypothetical protein
MADRSEIFNGIMKSSKAMDKEKLKTVSATNVCQKMRTGNASREWSYKVAINAADPNSLNPVLVVCFLVNPDQDPGF